MAISRPFLLALLGAALLGATFFAVTQARENSSDEAVPAAQQAQPEQQAAQSQPEPAASPQDTLKNLFATTPSSAGFDVELSVRSGGDSGSLSVSGAFERGAVNDVPTIEVDANVDLLGDKLEGGFVAVDDKAYFTQASSAWQVPDEAWGPVVEAFANGQVGGGDQAQQAVLANLKPQNWVGDVKDEGKETVDGVETSHVSATVDSNAIVKDLAQIPGAGATQLPSAAEVDKVVEKAQVDAWVGSDKIVRRLRAELALNDPADGRASVEFELNLTDVNKPQQIEAPANVRDGLPGGTFGEFAQGLATGLGGFTGGEPISLEALSTNNPRRAARAVAANKKVVIFFRNPRGLDDQAVSQAVRAVANKTSALVLTDHVDAVERYGKMVEDLGVSQAPSIVIIDRTGNARLIEGYVDSESLAQAVADAR